MKRTSVDTNAVPRRAVFPRPSGRRLTAHRGADTLDLRVRPRPRRLDLSNAAADGLPSTWKLQGLRAAAGLWFCLFFCTSQAAASPGALQKELNRFSNNPGADEISLSVLFAPLDGDPLGAVEYQPRHLVVPASVTKLVSSYAALDVLGPDHSFSTEVFRQGTINEHGVLSGDLVVKGSGDPFFVSERMWLLANQLRQNGLGRIEGDLVLHIESPTWSDPTVVRSADGSDRAYAASPSVLAINFNAVALHVTPGKNAGDPILVTNDPLESPYLSIENKLVTGKRGTSPKWHFDLAPTAEGRALGEQLANRSVRWISDGRALEIASLRGRIPAGTQPFVVYRRVRYPLGHFGFLFRAFLEQAGIEVGGHVVFDTDVPPNKRLLKFESLPVQDLLRSMNRYSNNFIANQLTIAVYDQRKAESLSKESLNADEIHGTPGAPVLSARPSRLADAGTSLRDWLYENNYASPGISLEDGSGLSSNNRLTAETLTQLLIHGWNDFDVMPKLISTLPGPRGLGTLRSRFGGSAPAPDLWAKTGTFPDGKVSSLAGYFDSPEGPVAFAILMDGATGSRWTVKRMQTLQEFWIDLYLK